MEQKTKGYKGFDKDLKCRGFQYKVGETYKTDNAEVCETGFHFCENPFDVFYYYPPSCEKGVNRFCEVEGGGKIDKDCDGSKIACSEIKIGAEIKLDGIINAGVKFILDKVKWVNNKDTNTGDYSAATNTGNCSAATNTGNCSAATNTGDRSAATNTGDRSAATNTGNCSAATNTGDYSAATNTGDYSAATNTGNRSAATNTGDYSAATNTGNYSAATNTGYRSAATNTGYRSAATNTGDYSAATNTGNCSAASVEGKESIAIATGKDSRAKGALGCWIVLAERDEWNGESYPILNVKAFKVDNLQVKADTYYMLVNGELKEAE